MIFGIWNARSLYRAGSPKTVASELAKYNLDPVEVQEFRWDEGCSQPADSYTFFHGNGDANHNLRTGFFINEGNISAVLRQ
jgi:hypothetical protein